MRVVIPSLMYGDYLAALLPAWCDMVSRSAITVVTSPADVETRDVARRDGVACLTTPAWQRDGAVLNKARALDEGFGFRGRRRPAPADGEVCLALDADVFPFGRFPTDEEIASDTLYGCPRYYCPNDALLQEHRAGAVPRERLRLIVPGQRKGPGPHLLDDSPKNAAACAERALGYFQLFRWRRGISFGTSRSASRYDLDFHRHFTHRRALSGFYVLHLGDQDRANWRGRILPLWEG